MAWGPERGFGGFSRQQQALSLCTPEDLNSEVKSSNVSGTYCKMGTVHLLPASSPVTHPIALFKMYHDSSAERFSAFSKTTEPTRGLAVLTLQLIF